jgi:hypothetical protein
VDVLCGRMMCACEDVSGFCGYEAAH